VASVIRFARRVYRAPSRATRAARGSPRAADATDRQIDPDRQRVGTRVGGASASDRARRRAWPPEPRAVSARAAQCACGFADAAGLPRTRGTLTPAPAAVRSARWSRPQTKFRAGALDTAPRSASPQTRSARSTKLDFAPESNCCAGKIAFVSSAWQRCAPDAARGRPPAHAAISDALLRDVSRGRFRRRCSLDVWRRRAPARSTWRFAAKAASRPSVLRGPELLLDGLATFSGGFEAAVPLCAGAAEAFDVSRPAGERATALEVARDRLVRSRVGTTPAGQRSRAARADARETGASASFRSR